MPYRKRNDSDVWHWCYNCTQWPTADFTEGQTKPESATLCDECRAKYKAGECHTES